MDLPLCLHPIPQFQSVHLGFHPSSISIHPSIHPSRRVPRILEYTLSFLRQRLLSLSISLSTFASREQSPAAAAARNPRRLSVTAASLYLATRAASISHPPPLRTFNNVDTYIANSSLRACVWRTCAYFLSPLCIPNEKSCSLL